MNPWQVARQLKWLIAAETWPGGSGAKVAGSVIVTAGTEADIWGQVREPFVFLNVADSSPDDDQPSLLSQRFNMVIGQKVLGDSFGEKAILGGARLEVGKSAGRGVLEIEEAVLGAVDQLRRLNGVAIRTTWRSGIAAGIIQGFGNVAQRAYGLEALCTIDRYYHPPQNLAKSGSTVSWTLPPARFDRYKIVLNKISGSTPPSSATDGSATTVTLGSDLATSVSDSTSGTWTYAVWAAYDETSATPAEAQRYSDAGALVPGTTLTVS